MCQNNIGKLNSSEKRSSLQRHNQQKKVQLGLCWNFTMSYIKSCDFSFLDLITFVCAYISHHGHHQEL